MGWLEQLLRRAAPGDVPADPMAGSVMSPNYVPETSRRQLGLGALRGLLDVTPVGIADAVQSGINNMQSPLGAALRAVVGKSALPGDVALGKLGLLGNGPGYDAGRYAANAATPMMGLLGNQAGGALPKGYARNQAGAIVYHGSPYKFDRFDASKIGTGEGAQAYGMGHYAAEAQATGQSYKDTLRGLRTDTQSVVRDLMPDRHFTTKERAEIFRAAFDEGTPVDKAARQLGNRQASIRDVPNDVLLEAVKRVREDAQGYLYKIDLPDDKIAKMLDWDKPLSQQSAEVQAAANARLSELRALGGSPPKDPSGEWLHRAFQPQAGEQGFGQSLAADRLRAQGIPGIRYLDGGSRGAGAGSSNFVVFPGNEGLLNILERNGKPIR